MSKYKINKTYEVAASCGRDKKRVKSELEACKLAKKELILMDNEGLLHYDSLCTQIGSIELRTYRLERELSMMSKKKGKK